MPKKIIKAQKSAFDNLNILFNFSLRSKYIFLALAGFIFYANSILNKYAFDDGIAIDGNTFVKMGFAGIPKILTHDSYANLYASMGNDPGGVLSAGRYRPLSQIVFAIEEQFMRNSDMLPYALHLTNVLAYMACLIAIFYFLENFLLKSKSGGEDIAIISVFLFAIHPLHTEVVANIKSLDEILSMLFIMLTFIFSLKYLQSRSVKDLVIGTGSFLLALLSKEYALMLIILVPLLFYLLTDKKWVAIAKAQIPYLGILIVYLALRLNAVGFHINKGSSNLLYSNPYFYATYAQKIATEWFVLGKYLVMMALPYPLACDYSYYQIPYHNFSDISVLLSILVYLGITIWGILLIRKKDVLAFAVSFYLFTIFMISNFVLDIGASMGERLVFHSSLGFVIIISYYLFGAIPNTLVMKLRTKKNIVLGVLSGIGILCFGETFTRNAQWKDDTSLFIHDAGVVPNSFLVNNNAGNQYLILSQKKENTLDGTKMCRDSARKYLFRGLHFNPTNEFAYHTLGILYIDEGMFDSAKYCYDIVEKLHPGLKSNYTLLSKFYLHEGISLAKNGNLSGSISYMKRALTLDSTNAEVWFDMAMAYYRIQQYDSEKYALIKTLQNNPSNIVETNAKNDLEDLSHIK
jgi:hypothetical protein